MVELSAFLADPAGIALKGMLVAAFVDFAVGSFAAAKDGTFALSAFAAFASKHLLGRVFPISTLLLVGFLTGDSIMSAAGGVAAGAYVAETMGSVYSSIKDMSGNGEDNPVPTA